MNSRHAVGVCLHNGLLRGGKERKSLWQMQEPFSGPEKKYQILEFIRYCTTPSTLKSMK
jgi:hypothetical protein